MGCLLQRCTSCSSHRSARACGRCDESTTTSQSQLRWAALDAERKCESSGQANEARRKDQGVSCGAMIAKLLHPLTKPALLIQLGQSVHESVTKHPARGRANLSLPCEVATPRPSRPCGRAAERCAFRRHAPQPSRALLHGHVRTDQRPARLPSAWHIHCADATHEHAISPSAACCDIATLSCGE